MKKYMNIVKGMMIGLVFSMNLLISGNDLIQKHNDKKNINWVNVIKTTMLSSVSLWYTKVVMSYIIRLVKKEGLAGAIAMHKKHPFSLIRFVCLATLNGVIAYDYAQQ